MDLTKDYYTKAITLWKYSDKKKAMFFLGAAIHIVQDMTVPQHANVKLLDDHHQFESFVKKAYKDLEGFNNDKGPYILDNIEDYVRFNTRVSLKVYRKFKNIQEDECRYFRTLRCTLPLAKRTTAGVFLLFYNDISDDE